MTTKTSRPAPAPRSAQDRYVDHLLRAQIRAVAPGGKVPVFVRDENVAAHYGISVNTFVLLPPDEALYMLEGRWAYSVHGPNIAAGNYLEHPIAGPFVPYSGIPPAPEPAPEPPPEPSPPPAPEPPPEPAPSPPAVRSSGKGK